MTPTAYIKFLLKSTNQHGIHSPFVYELVTKCFYDKTQVPSYEKIKNYREKLLQNKTRIKVTDYGAGSRVFSSEERKISAIAKNVGIPLKRAKLLNRLIRYLNIEDAIELGTSLGISTAAMAAGNKIKITTLEGCPETAKIAQNHFDAFNLNNIELKVAEFDVLLNDIVDERKKRKEEREEKKEKINDQRRINRLPQSPKKLLRNKQQTTNLIFFDGNHQKKTTLAYFEKLLPLAHNNSIFIFDDIHWSKEMEEAWEEIKNHPKVKLSIDTFYWGIIFFRKEQEKQHLVVRV